MNIIASHALPKSEADQKDSRAIDGRIHDRLTMNAVNLDLNFGDVRPNHARSLDLDVNEPC
jgi:hypothetical protein